jgi:hypothetical protein
LISRCVFHVIKEKETMHDALLQPLDQDGIVRAEMLPDSARSPEGPIDPSGTPALPLTRQAQRIRELIDRSTDEADPSSSVVGGLGAELLLLQHQILAGVGDLIARDPDPLAVIEDCALHINTALKVGSQAQMYLLLSQRLQKQTVAAAVTGPSSTWISEESPKTSPAQLGGVIHDCARDASSVSQESDPHPVQ